MHTGEPVGRSGWDLYADTTDGNEYAQLERHSPNNERLLHPCKSFGLEGKGAALWHKWV